MPIKSITFVDRLVGSVDPASQTIKDWTPYAEHLFGIGEARAVGKGCFALFRSRNLLPEPGCRKDCVAVEHFRVDEVYACPMLDVSETLPGATRVKMVGIPHLDSSGRYSVELYAWPEKNAISLQPAVRVRALGNFRVSDRRDVALDMSTWHRKQAERLLRLLVVCRRAAVHRDVLIDAMWPDLDSVRGWARLRVVLHGLRTELADAIGRTDLVVTHGEAYSLNREAFAVDIDAFELAFAEARTCDQAGDTEAALAAYRQAELLYAGDLFADTPYEAFVDNERRRLLQTIQDVRRRLRELTMPM